MHAGLHAGAHISAQAAVHSSKALWYLTRGSGLVATLLLTASVVLGIVTTNRVSGPGWPRFLIAAVHRNVSLFVMVVLGFHITVAVLDSYAPLAWVDAILPLHSAYRPLWTGLGALALDLLLAVVVTSLLRTRLGYRRWRAVHWAAYASWVSAIVHGLGTGTDVKTRWVLVMTAGCVLAVLAALAWRLVEGWPAHRKLRVTAGVVAVVSVAALTGWVKAGPLHSGWARRAGTPASLLGSRSAASGTASTSAASTKAAPTLTQPFQGTLTGTVAQSGVDSSGLTHVTLSMAVAGTVPARLTVVITGTPSAGGGVSETASSVRFTATGAASSWSGTLSALDGDRLTCLVTNGGRRLTLSLRVAIDSGSGAVTGDLQGAPS